MIARIRKALVAGIGAGLAALSTGMLDGSLSQADWITIVGSTLVIALATWRVPNAKAGRRP